MGISYFEARMVSLIPSVFHLSSLERANLATQADQLVAGLYHVTRVVNVPILPSSCTHFGRYKQNENGKEKLERDLQDRMRRKDPNHIEVMWR